MGGQKPEKAKTRHSSTPTPGTFEYIVSLKGFPNIKYIHS